MFKISWLLLFFATFFSTNNEEEQLIIFWQPQTDQLFRNQCLPEIEAYTKQQGIALIVKNATEGLPASITTTPAIVFQNALGRSIYAGRYMEINTIKNFIRTARLVAQPEVLLEKEAVLTWKPGRAKILAPLKVTPLQGQVPANYNAEHFYREVQEGLAAGMDSFNIAAKSVLERTDRSFYVDVHPYLDESGRLYISWSLFSQFSCIEAVDQNFDKPLQIAFSKRMELFIKLGQEIQLNINNQLKASKIGDAYTPLSLDIPTTNWEQLGLPLPKAAIKLTALEIPEDLIIKENWEFAGPIKEDLPALQFRFQAPLDRYAGEVKTLKGSFSLNEAKQIVGGYFEAETQSMTMGMESLDQKVLKSYLKAKKYPVSSFKFEKIAPHTALTWGLTTEVNIEGTFKLLKYKRATKVKALLTPMLDQAGNPQILAQVSFDLNIIDDFGIEGPDGPDPARKMLVTSMRFINHKSHTRV